MLVSAYRKLRDLWNLSFDEPRQAKECNFPSLLSAQNLGNYLFHGLWKFCQEHSEVAGCGMKICILQKVCCLKFIHALLRKSSSFNKNLHGTNMWAGNGLKQKISPFPLVSFPFRIFSWLKGMANRVIRKAAWKLSGTNKSSCPRGSRFMKISSSLLIYAHNLEPCVFFKRDEGKPPTCMERNVKACTTMAWMKRGSFVTSQEFS